MSYLNKFALGIMLLSPSIAFAIMCPTNFNQIDFGATIDQVQAQCGKADSEDVKEIKPEGPQEWTYFVPQTVSMNNMQPANGTQKMTVDFDKDGKVINISVNGVGVGSTQICGSALISLGDTRDSIKSACGTAANVANMQPGDNSAQPQQSTKVTTDTYNTSPPVKLIYENGVLVRRE